MSERIIPADEEQRKCIEQDIRETLFVEAGAGTGKTHELVQRIVRLVASGARLGRIAAITFTDAAAAELRDRVRQELERAAEGGDELYEWMPAGERDLCATAANSIDTAAIQTLHSFAQRILSLHPLEAGLPPRISIADEVRASLRFDERWKDFVQELLESPPPAVEQSLLRAQILGLTPYYLRQIAERFHKEWDRLEGAHFDASPLPPVDATPVVEVLREAFELAKGYHGPPADKLWGHLENLRPRARYLEMAQRDRDAATGDAVLTAEENLLRLLQKLAAKKAKVGDQRNWGSQLKGDVQRALEEADRLAGTILRETKYACLGPLLDALRKFVLEYRDARIADGSLEFHDLLVLARNLLRDNETVRQAVHDRFDYILIDEFQDTDPLQVQIAARIATDASPEAAEDWSALPVPSGRLFFVGDPKQSIYRFRRADIDLYRSVQGHFGAPPVGERVSLTQNFRTVAEIITWANETFETLFARLSYDPPPAGDGPPPAQVSFQWLQSARTLPENAGPAVTLLGEPKEDPGNAEQLRAREAADIARAVRCIRGEGAPAWQVYDKHLDGWRNARYQDITILLPTRTTLPALENALEASGIPLRVEARSLLFQTQDVRDLVSILAAIDDPTDAVSVVAALRSPGYACGDDDLYGYKRARGYWDYTWGLREETFARLGEEHPVISAMQSLAELHEERLSLSVSALVDKVIRERQLFELAFAARRPRETWARLRFVQEQARAFVDAGGSTLRQFVQWMHRQAEEQSRVVESVVPEEDDDAVRIMTVHASKGLEFPIVLLAGLNTKDNNLTPQVLWGEDGQPEVRVGSKASDTVFETEGYEPLKKHEQAMERLEDDRLLYVAATRARDHLVISAWHKPEKQPHDARHRNGRCNAAECLWAICDEHPELWERFPHAPAVEDAEADTEAGVLETAEQHAQWVEARAALIAKQSRPRRFGATTVAQQVAADADAERDEAEPADDEAPWRRGRAGTSVGRAVHAVLQTVDLETGAGIEDAARAQAAAEGVAGREDEIARLARSAINSRAVQEAIASGRYWREVYVAAPIGEITIEGFIDLLYEGQDGLVVVDYKTDAARSDAEVAAKLERYRPQGAAYALAIEQTLKRPVARCMFVFVDERAAREREVTDLRAAIREVQDFAAKAAAPASA